MAIPESRRKRRRTQAWSPPMMLRRLIRMRPGTPGRCRRAQVLRPANLACRVQVLGDVVPPRLDLVLGVAAFLQPFTVHGQRAKPGTLKFESVHLIPIESGFRDEEVGDVAAAKARLRPKPPAMAAGQDTGEQIRMILQVELNRFLVPGRLDHAAELVNVARRIAVRQGPSTRRLTLTRLAV